MSVTQRLCETITAVTSASLGERELAAAHRLVLDGIAVAVAGARIEEAPSILSDYFREQDGKPVSSVIGFGYALPPVPAALVNGASMHVLDFEPMWKPATHALSPALSATLALAEARGADGREIGTALIKGIEIQGWLREAGKTESHELKFHPPGFVGPIGAAVAASHLLGFSAEDVATAIGIASSRCGGLFSNVGTMSKSTHCGYAAALGLESALLASRGFTGSKETFDAKTQGYAQAFMPPSFDAEMLLRFGPPFRVVEPGYAIKIFPAKFSTHYGITAALALHPAIPAPDAIRAVRVVAAQVPSSDRPMPATGLEGKFSVQYTVAAALLDGRVGLDTFTDGRLRRADMQTLLPKIAFTMSPDIPSLYDAGRYTEVEVDLADGRTLRERCERPRGSWGAAPITQEEHLQKVRTCLATALAPGDVERCIELGAQLEKLDAEGVKLLMRLVREAGATNSAARETQAAD